MRKQIVGIGPTSGAPTGQNWLDLERLAEVEVTSEDSAHPVESALVPVAGASWRADGPGEQAIRLLFHEPVQLHRIRLVFRETQTSRTQEFVLRWSADGGVTYRDIIRQQYTFSPQGSTTEVEDYVVKIEGATIIELRIVPDISGGNAPASLLEIRFA